MNCRLHELFLLNHSFSICSTIKHCSSAYPYSFYNLHVMLNKCNCSDAILTSCLKNNALLLIQHFFSFSRLSLKFSKPLLNTCLLWSFYVLFTIFMYYLLPKLAFSLVKTLLLNSKCAQVCERICVKKIHTFSLVLDMKCEQVIIT